MYLLFIEKGTKVLSQQGHLCYINPIRFFNSDYNTGIIPFYQYFIVYATLTYLEVALILTVPALIPVTRPVSSTVAIVSSLDFQVTV